MTTRRGRRPLLAASALSLLGALVLAAATGLDLAPVHARLPPLAQTTPLPRVLARDGTPLVRSYRSRWNVHDRVALHDVPALLRDAFIQAEDRRFDAHAGVDWPARLHALWQNLKAARRVRGASTISEQAVRLLHPRPRTVWSRWLEGFDALRLERRHGKAAILEFYLNQVPYAANRRGVVQAARHYFDRSLQTLSPREMLTLAVLVRAPSRLDPHRSPAAADEAVARLARRMLAAGRLARPLARGRLQLRRGRLPLAAPHFLRHVRARAPAGRRRLRTTLEPALQRHLDRVLTQRLAALGPRGARHGAALVVEHETGAVRAWVVASRPGIPPTHIDAVQVPRQPGSTLKPFVYALALERGWSAATQIDDAPLATSVGTGLHAYRNYSRRHYGPVSVREALGSSLNVPAVKALAFVGADALIARLRRLGMASLDRHPDVYGDGLALGNGEVSLEKLVQAYAALAGAGELRALRTLDDAPGERPRRQVLDADVSAIIADILADADARALEFGAGGALALPVQTAVKTGTSSDHRDAWAIGFDYRHAVGIWIGDLDRGAMDGVSGATGPALVLREAFAFLNRSADTRPLARSRRLRRRSVCVDPGPTADADCRRRRSEWFVPGTEPAPARPRVPAEPLRIRQPSPGLRLALDPRLPRSAQRFRFSLLSEDPSLRVTWFVDARREAQSAGPDYLWTLTPGDHRVRAEATRGAGGAPRSTATVHFSVR